VLRWLVAFGLVTVGAAISLALPVSGESLRAGWSGHRRGEVPVLVRLHRRAGARR
jgi:hypothetical protein